MAPSTKDSPPPYSASLSNPLEALSFPDPTQQVTFRVGPNLKEFFVHKEPACYHSPILKAALESGSIEGQTQTYTLDDTTEGAFQLLVQWLYSQKLTTELRDASSGQLYDGTLDDQTKDKILEKATEDLVGLWILAGKLMMPVLQNDSMDAIVWYYQKLQRVVFNAAAAVYAQTAPGSQLRRVYVDFYTGIDVESIVKNQKDLPKQMLLDIMVAKENKPAFQVVASNYHIPVPI